MACPQSLSCPADRGTHGRDGQAKLLGRSRVAHAVDGDGFQDGPHRWRDCFPDPFIDGLALRPLRRYYRNLIEIVARRHSDPL